MEIKKEHNYVLGIIILILIVAIAFVFVIKNESENVKDQLTINESLEQVSNETIEVPVKELNITEVKEETTEEILINESEIIE